MFCVHCGNENPLFARYCKRCGKAIEQPVSTIQDNDAVGNSVTSGESSDAVPQREEPQPIDTAVADLPVSVALTVDSPTDVIHAVPNGSATEFVLKTNLDALSREYTGLSERAVGFIADLAVIYFISFGLCFLYGLTSRFWSLPAFNDVGGYYAVFIFSFLAYMILAQSLYHTTIGKYVVDSEICSNAGKKRYPNLFRVLLRESLGKYASLLFWGYGFWGAAKNPQKRTWGDRLAGTVVTLRPTNKTLKRSLAVFAVLAAILDMGLIVWGQTKEEKDKRRDVVLQELKSASSAVETDRATVQEALSGSPNNIPEFRSTMAGVLRLLDTYDAALSRWDQVIQQYENEGLYVSETDREQTSALRRLYQIRRKQSQVLRNEAQLVVDFDAQVSSWADLTHQLKEMDSDIESYERDARRELVLAGVK